MFEWIKNWELPGSMIFSPETPSDKLLKEYL